MQNKMDSMFNLIETVFVAIFVGCAWSSSLPFLVLGSFSYWLICGLSTAYLILLLVKLFVYSRIN
jgi:hypothetical protein